MILFRRLYIVGVESPEASPDLCKGAFARIARSCTVQSLWRCSLLQARLALRLQVRSPRLNLRGLESSRPRRMAWTAEQKRGRRAQRKRDRAADDERRGVKRKPRGRPPLYHRWDDSAGAWVLDEAGEAVGTATAKRGGGRCA